jgi:hypothetical protein
MERDLKLLTPTALKPIKQVELWKKWGPLLPEEARAITCPKPSDEVIESIKERTKMKGKERLAEKKKRKKVAAEDAVAAAGHAESMTTADTTQNTNNNEMIVSLEDHDGDNQGNDRAHDSTMTTTATINTPKNSTTTSNMTRM